MIHMLVKLKIPHPSNEKDGGIAEDTSLWGDFNIFSKGIWVDIT